MSNLVNDIKDILVLYEDDNFTDQINKYELVELLYRALKQLESDNE